MVDASDVSGEDACPETGRVAPPVGEVIPKGLNGREKAFERVMRARAVATYNR